MTSHPSTAQIPHSPGTYRPRDLLRLALSPSPGRGALDGGWWPQSRDLEFELADLVDHLPAEVGRVQRVLYARPDWDTQPHTVRVARGLLKAGSFPGDDSHMILLRLWSRTDLRLLVVPPEHAVGDQAMRLAADPGNRWSTAQILAAGAFDQDDGDGDDHWTDESDSWWRSPAFGSPWTGPVS